MLGGSLLSDGAIVLLDYQMASHSPLSPAYYGGITVPNLFRELFGIDLGSKLLFCAILVAAYALGVMITRTLALWLHIKNPWYIEACMGIFFLMQPFASERLITQPIVYLGIVFLGFLIAFLIRFSTLHSPRDMVMAGVF